MTTVGIWNDSKRSMERTNLDLVAWKRELPSGRPRDATQGSLGNADQCGFQSLENAIDSYPAFAGGFEIVGIREEAAINGCGRVVMIEQPNTVSPYAPSTKFLVHLACLGEACAVGAVEDISH